MEVNTLPMTRVQCSFWVVVCTAPEAGVVRIATECFPTWSDHEVGSKALTPTTPIVYPMNSHSVRILKFERLPWVQSSAFVQHRSGRDQQFHASMVQEEDFAAWLGKRCRGEQRSGKDLFAVQSFTVPKSVAHTSTLEQIAN